MEWEKVKVKILGLSATPVKGGNCDTLVQECLKMTKEMGDVETDFITLADKKIEMCKHCQWCIENMSPCRIQDDAHKVLERIEECDGLIIGSPTWYNTLSPLIPILFSRTRYHGFFTHAFRNKAVGFLTLGYLGFGLDNSLSVLKTMFMPINTLLVAEGRAMTSTRVFGQRPAYLEHGVLDDTWGVRQAQGVATRVVEVARMIKYATKDGIVLPEKYKFTASGGRAVPREKKVFVEGTWREKE